MPDSVRNPVALDQLSDTLPFSAQSVRDFRLSTYGDFIRSTSIEVVDSGVDRIFSRLFAASRLGKTDVTVTPGAGLRRDSRIVCHD